MLLKALYDLANSPQRHILDDPAFTVKPVRWIIDLDRNGNMLGEGPNETGDGKRGREYSCPKTTRKKSTGGVAEFLADGITALFGLDLNPDAPMPDKKRADRDANNARKTEDFWRQIMSASESKESPLLHAVLAWKERNPQTPSFLKWCPTAPETGKGHWIITKASGEKAKLGPDDFSFRVDNQLLLEEETIRQWWQDVYTNEVTESKTEAARGICLVSGKPDQPIPLTHSKISGVPQTQSFGASIVSFDKPSFTSYGFKQNLNAPISDDAAKAYCASLNWLLNQKDHNLIIGNSVLCFWARESESHTAIISDLLNSPQPDVVRKFLLSPWGGIPREAAFRDQFFAVTLSGNVGRIAIRHWLQCPLAQALENLNLWFKDLWLEVPSMPAKENAKTSSGKTAKQSSPLSLYRLACTTVRDAKELQPGVPAMLYRAALTGVAPSVSMLQPMLRRLHSCLTKDDKYRMIFDESRFALLKLIANRNRKDGVMEIQPKLTAETTDPAYNCGRLLAIFDSLQKSAHRAGNTGGMINNTIAEKYFAAASGSPSSAFAILWRLHQHHLKKLRQTGKVAAAERYRAEIAEISTRFQKTNAAGAPIFPRTLTLLEQARFALGFYQQEAARIDAVRAWKEGQEAKAGDTSDSEREQDNIQ